MTAATASVPAVSFASTPAWSLAASIAFVASSAAFLASAFAAVFSASESLLFPSIAFSFAAKAAATAAFAAAIIVSLLFKKLYFSISDLADSLYLLVVFISELSKALISVNFVS